MTNEDIRGLIARLKNLKQPEFTTAILHPSHKAEIDEKTDHPWGSDFQVPPEIETEFMKQWQQTICSAMGIPASLFEEKREYNWHRFPDESLLNWGNRLFDKGLLDNPEIRWEYQKAILGSPFTTLKAIWAKVQE